MSNDRDVRTIKDNHIKVNAKEEILTLLTYFTAKNDLPPDWLTIAINIALDKTKESLRSDAKLMFDYSYFNFRNSGIDKTFETFFRDALAHLYPKIFGKTSNHNYDADIINLCFEEMGIELKITLGNSFIFGQQPTGKNKKHYPYTLLIDLDCPTLERIQKENLTLTKIINRIVVYKVYWGYLPNHPGVKSLSPNAYNKKKEACFHQIR